MSDQHKHTSLENRRRNLLGSKARRAAMKKLGKYCVGASATAYALSAKGQQGSIPGCEPSDEVPPKCEPVDPPPSG